MPIASIWALAGVLLLGVLAKGHGIVHTALGMLPAHLAAEIEATHLSRSVLEGADSHHEAVNKMRDLQRAVHENKEKTVNNLFVAWSQAVNKTYADVDEATSELEIFNKIVDSLTHTQLRERSFLFSAPYYENGNLMTPITLKTSSSARPRVYLGTRLFMSRRKAFEMAPDLSGITAPDVFTHVGGSAPVAVNQGSVCSSCWANSAVEAISAAVNLVYKAKGQTSIPILYTRQMIVDCANSDLDSNYISSGCHMGDPADALDFATKYSIPLELAYPYTSHLTGNTGTCKDWLINLANNKSYTGPWLQLKSYTIYGAYYDEGPMTEGDLMKAVSIQPVVFYWTMSIIFSNLKKGQTLTVAMMDDEVDGCWSDCDTTDHAMLLVGYNAITRIWTVQNSWGKKWANEGRFDVEFYDGDAGPCSMYCYVLGPSLEFTTLPARIATQPASPPRKSPNPPPRKSPNPPPTPRNGKGSTG